MNPVDTLETAKATNPLVQLHNFGQSVWLDYIRRDLMKTGELQRLITDDGLRGMTSNPSIFEKAIAGGQYQDFLESLAGRSDLDAKGRYELLAIRDIQDAADILAPVYKSTRKRDGYVSLEVSPYLAHDTNGTLDEARRLWKSVARDNVMIKVPGTTEGIPAIRQLISEGINVNVTLLFAQPVYEEVAAAFIDGVEKFARGRRRCQQGRQRGQFLHQPHRFARRLARRRPTEERNGPSPQSEVGGDSRKGRHRQWQADL